MRAQYCRPAGCTLSPVIPADPEKLAKAASTTVAPLMPTQAEVDNIPEDYFKDAEAFVTATLCGMVDIVDTRFLPAPGVNTLLALTHIEKCLWGPWPSGDYEDRVLGCAVLVTRFFENIKYSVGRKSTSFEGFIYAIG